MIQDTDRKWWTTGHYCRDLRKWLKANNIAFESVGLIPKTVTDRPDHPLVFWLVLGDGRSVLICADDYDGALADIGEMYGIS